MNFARLPLRGAVHIVSWLVYFHREADGALLLGIEEPEVVY